MLLLDEKKLVKTKMFSSPSYIGDPKNTIKLFNEMNCSEIIMIDIGLNKKNEKINLNFLENVVSEAFMPVSYGGGIQNLNNIFHSRFHFHHINENSLGSFTNTHIYRILKNKESMGFGDAKLLAIICFLFSWICLPLVIFSSVFIGLI